MAPQYRALYSYFASWQGERSAWATTTTRDSDCRRTARVGHWGPAAYDGPTARHPGPDYPGSGRRTQPCPDGTPSGVDGDTVRLWRQRWLSFQGGSLEDVSVAERLADAPRPGHPARLTAAQGCPIVARACAAPSGAGRPLSPWTSRESAEEIRARGIVEPLSPRQAARRLKKPRGNRTCSGLG